LIKKKYFLHCSKKFRLKKLQNNKLLMFSYLQK
jgi:hypothetical protein